MLKTTKGLTVGAVLSFLASLILYQVIGFQSTDSMELEHIVFLLFPAQLCLIFGILFTALAILVYKGYVDTKKLKKPLVAAVSVACAVCVAVCSYAYSTVYDTFTYGEDGAKNMPENVQEMFPYFYQDNRNYSRYNVNYSHFAGTDYVNIWGASYYDAEYFRSTSPFMNLQFWMEKSFVTPFSSVVTVVDSEGTEKSVDGVSLISYVDGDTYAVRIDGLFSTFYVYLRNARLYDESLEDFEKTAVRQYNLIKQAVKDGAFLDDSIWPD
ncbi:MAG: hypothetical protein ACI4SB_03685 [Acutalibacteraceae bacterium]